MRSSDAIAASRKKNLVFRVDGGRSVGMGHVVRCLSLAEVLRDAHGCSISFCMNQDEVGVARVQAMGWLVAPVAAEQSRFSDGQPIGDGASGEASIVDALIVDLPNGVSAEFVRALRISHPEALLVLMDGTCSGRLEADLVFSPIERLAQASSWAGFRGQRFEGPAYAILNPAYAGIRKRASAFAQLPRILVTMGGSDPCGVTLHALRALDGMSEPFEIAIAAGPAFMHEAELAAWSDTAKHRFEIRRDHSLLELMLNSDVAVVSFGTTVYELAATGLPAIALSISDDHWQSAQVFARYGSMISLGLYSSVDDATIQASVRTLLTDRARWFAMAQCGQAAVDGKGAERVAELLMSSIQRKHKSRAEGEVGKSHRV